MPGRANRRQFLRGTGAALAEVNDGGICCTFALQWNPDVLRRVAAARKAAGRGTPRTGDDLPPDCVFQPGSMKVSSHLEDLIASVRSRAAAMSVESLRRGRKVRWDAVREEIV